jgi:hypothetical protein
MTKRIGGKAAKHPLPFITDRKRGGSSYRRWWHVHPTGDYGADCETGRAYADAYVDFCRREFSSSGLVAPPLQWIVKDMPRQMSGIEISFLSKVGAMAVTA